MLGTRVIQKDTRGGRASSPPYRVQFREGIAAGGGRQVLAAKVAPLVQEGARGGTTRRARDVNVAAGTAAASLPALHLRAVALHCLERPCHQSLALVRPYPW